jgi:hypothetical protein
MNFEIFKKAIASRFEAMTATPIYCTAIEKDTLWDTYLKSFPEGTNPIFRERSVHDCVYCKQFIRAVGNTVSIEGGKLTSIWDCKVADPTYQAVADAMAKAVKSHAIADEFLHTEKTAGRETNYEQKTTDGPILTWDHFHVHIPYGRNTGANFFCPEDKIGTKQGEARSLHEAYSNSLNKLSLDAVETVLDLIKRAAFYKSEENLFAVMTFLTTKRLYDALPDEAKDAFIWDTMRSAPASVAKIRGTSIGTLIDDISSGRDLESAVSSFEAKVAPTNYKRSTALVTQKQVDAAKKTLDDLGLTSALDRRYAALTDIKVTDILFVDRAVRPLMRNDVFGSIATKPTTRAIGSAEDISIQNFLLNVVPRIDSLEAFVDNSHANNLMSLIAPVDPKALPLLKWENGFSWSYNGDVTDSIKERVKQAGGNVTGDLCCRLAWNNKDDLDLHLIEPDGTHIYFRNKKSYSSGGELDVDKNAGGANLTREPVENIFYQDRRRMQEGQYKLFVNNFYMRESIDVGFQVDIDYLGNVTHFVYSKAVLDSANISVAEFTYSHKEGIKFINALPSSQSSKEVWGLKTMDFHKVNTLMLSPNYWGEQGSGNKHFFFMLDGCRNDGSARGFYNEFLRESLMPHRKVLEIVGSKMRTDHADEQLSGLGFSSTQRNHLLVRTKGNLTRTLKINF